MLRARVRGVSLALALAGALFGGGMAGAQDSTTVRGESAGERRTSSGPFSLIVDLSERELYVMRGDEVERTYPVAIGKPEHPTPRGSFNVRRLIWNPRWVPPDAAWARNRRARAPGDPRNPMGRVKIFFRAPDYYIHGTHQEDSLGQAESHGCIRMRNADVIELARMVMENGGARRSPTWFRQVVNRVRSTAEVGLSSSVTLRIRE